MRVQETLQSASQALTVERVYGKPYERNGTTIIPVAHLRGAAGGGGGHGPDDQGSGEGSGFGISARPAGVYVISGDRVRWQPALDLNRVIVGGQLVAALALLAVRAGFRARAARQ